MSDAHFFQASIFSMGPLIKIPNEQIQSKITVHEAYVVGDIPDGKTPGEIALENYQLELDLEGVGNIDVSPQERQEDQERQGEGS